METKTTSHNSIVCPYCETVCDTDPGEHMQPDRTEEGYCERCDQTFLQTMEIDVRYLTQPSKIINKGDEK